jgi:hypothetical protein
MMHGLSVFIAGEPICETDQRRLIVSADQKPTHFSAGDKNRSRDNVQIGELPDFFLEFFDRAHFLERLYVADDNR